MSDTDLLELFREHGALLTGHFRLSSGKHSDTYLQCALVLAHPPSAERLAARLARVTGLTAVDVVVGPALGGIIIAHELARALNATACFTERDQDGAMTLRRGFGYPRGARVLVCEDVVTTGVSTCETMAALAPLGGEVVGVASLVHRARENPFEPLPLWSLVTLQPPMWDEASCPLCRQGSPITKPGSRRS